MKKIILTVALVFIASLSWGADSSLVNLTATTTPASTDLLYTVINPGTTPVDRKVTFGSMITNLGLLTSGGALGTPSSGTLTNATGLPIAGIASLGTGVGTAMAAATNGTGGLLTKGDAAGNAAVLTSYTKGAGTVAATDTILAAIQKLAGNDDAKAPLASPTFTGTTTLPDAPSCPVFASTSTATGNINIDGAAYCDYSWNNTGTAATYTPVITSAPASGKVRYVTFTVGGGSGVDTMTWTNVTWIGTAGAAATTTNKKSTYACIIPNTGSARCSIVAEAY